MNNGVINMTVRDFINKYREALLAGAEININDDEQQSENNHESVQNKEPAHRRAGNNSITFSKNAMTIPELLSLEVLDFATGEVSSPYFAQYKNQRKLTSTLMILLKTEESVISYTPKKNRIGMSDGRKFNLWKYPKTQEQSTEDEREIGGYPK